MSSNVRFWAYSALALVALFFVIFKTGLISVLALCVMAAAIAMAVRSAISTSGQTKDIITSSESAITDAVDVVENASTSAVDAVSRAANSAIESAKVAVAKAEDVVKGKR